MQLPWAQPRFVDHQVGEETLRFYEISGFKLIALKDVIRTIIDTMTQLQRSPREDAGSEETRDMERTEVNEQGKMAYMPKTLTVSKKSAISMELASYHDGERRKVLAVAVSQIVAPGTYREIIGLIVSSLRDAFPEKPTKQEMDTLVETMPLGTFVECIGGVMKANTKVFGPFEVLVRRAMQHLKDRLEKFEDQELDLE